MYFIILKMAEVCGQNINMNYNYCTKAVIVFVSRIIVKKLIIFQKLERE